MLSRWSVVQVGTALCAALACSLPALAWAQEPGAVDPPPVVPPLTGLTPPPPSAPAPPAPPVVARPDYTYVPDYPNYGPPKPVVPRRMHSPRMLMWGIIATAGGLTTLIVGAGITASAVRSIDVYCEGPVLCGALDDKPRRVAGSVVMIVGGAATAVGIPLWIRGAQSVPDTSPKKTGLRPSLGVGPGRASLAVDF
jgi:hypothetical protein